MTKAWFKQIFYYNEDFVPTLKLFTQLIRKDDKRFGNTSSKIYNKQRISRAIRHLVSSYNKTRLKEEESMKARLVDGGAANVETDQAQNT